MRRDLVWPARESLSILNQLPIQKYTRKCSLKACVSCFPRRQKSSSRATTPRWQQSAEARADPGRGPQVSTDCLCHLPPVRDLCSPQTGWSLNPQGQFPDTLHHPSKGKTEAQEKKSSQVTQPVSGRAGVRAQGPTSHREPLCPSLSFREHSAISELEEALRIGGGDSQGALAISQGQPSGRSQARWPLSNSPNQHSGV